MTSQNILIRRFCGRALVLVVIFLGCPAVDSAASVPVVVPGTQIAIIPPPGFTPAQLFQGFEDIATGSSIMVTEAAFPFDLIREGPTPAEFENRGMKLITSESVTYSGLPGLLISASQEANGIKYRKWLAIFGSDEKTAFVTASFPESKVAEMSAHMRSAVLSAKVQKEADVNDVEGLSFRIEETSELVISGRMMNMLMLTKDGLPGAGPEDPLVIVGSAHSQYKIEDIEVFSKNRIMQTRYADNIRDIKGKPTIIDGVHGYEITASANDSNTGIPMTLFQVIVPRQGTYYMIQGLVGKASADRYVPEFKKIADQMTFIE